MERRVRREIHGDVHRRFRRPRKRVRKGATLERRQMDAALHCRAVTTFAAGPAVAPYHCDVVEVHFAIFPCEDRERV